MCVLGTLCLHLLSLSLAHQSVVVTCFLWGWLETVSNTEPINNGFSKLPAPVRAAADALEVKKRQEDPLCHKGAGRGWAFVFVCFI